MKKVVLTYDSPGGVEIEQNIFGSFAEIIKIPCKSEEELIKNCKDADAVICSYEPFTDKVLSELPKLKIISVRAIGVDSVDVEAAKNRGIAVTNIPEYCINEVADHTIALMLTVNRRIIQFHESVQKDREWKFDLCPDITRFSENTIGLLGFGKIPKLVALRLKGFGCNVIAYDPFVDPKVAEEYGVKLVGLDELCRISDYISCHLPLNKDTNNMINKDVFSKMKKGVVFINTGRGKVVDEEALLDALNKKQVGFAALDVLQDEYPDMETNPFVGRDNVILTPHVAFYSTASVRDAKVQSAENVLYYLKGEYERCTIINGVNVDN